MIFAKLEASSITHPKILSVSNAAFGLYCKGLCYSVTQLSDGFVPKVAIPMLLGNAKQISELVKAGLWQTCENGWTVGKENWERHQNTRAQVEAQRQAWRNKKHKQVPRGNPQGNLQGNPQGNLQGNLAGVPAPDADSDSDSDSDKEKGEAESAPPDQFAAQLHKKEYNPVRDQANELAELFGSKAVPKMPSEKIPKVALAIAEKLRVHGLGTAERIREIIKDDKRDRSLPIAFVLQSLDRKPRQKTKEEMHAEIFGNQQPKRTELSDIIGAIGGVP